MNILLRYIRVEIVDKNGKITTIENNQSKGARIEFDVRRYPSSDGNGLNSAQVQIYNLTETTFDFINDNANTINIIAGYDEVINIIFSGQFHNVLRTKKGIDIITTIYCFSNFQKGLNTFIGKSCVDIELKDLLKQIADSNNLKLVLIDYNIFGGKITNYTLFSDTKKELNILGLKFNFMWYLDNGFLFVRPRNYNKVSFTITANSGLLKPPIRTDKGVDVELFLNPFLAPSDIFELSAKFADYNLAGVEFVEKIKSGGFSDKREVNTSNYIGIYQILQLTHEGSSHSNTWNTRISGLKYERKI